MAITHSMNTRTSIIRCKYVLGFLAYLYIMILAYRISDNQALIENLRIENEQKNNEMQAVISDVKAATITRRNHEEQLRKLNKIIISQGESLQKHEIQNSDLTLGLKNLERIVSIHKASNNLLGKRLYSSRSGEALQFTLDYKILHSYKKEKIYKNEFEDIEDYYTIMNIITQDGTILELEKDGKFINATIPDAHKMTIINFLDYHWK